MNQEWDTSGPPTDIPATELVIKLAEPFPSEVVDFPRTDKDGKAIGKIRIRVLKNEHEHEARGRAHGELRGQAKRLFGLDKLDAVDMQSPAVQEIVGDMVATETLAAACLHDRAVGRDDEDNPKTIFPRVFRSALEVRQRLSSDEIAVLFNHWRMVQHRFSPMAGGIVDKSDEDAWIARLRSGLDPLFLSRMSLPQLAEVTTSLAERLSSISQVLRSQWSSLPPSLASALERYCMATSYSGEPPVSSDEDGGARSSETMTLPRDRDLTDEESEAVARKLRREEP